MKRIYSILFFLAAFQGCGYDVEYITSQGVEVFCKDGPEFCVEQADLEHALNWYADNSDYWLDWPEPESYKLYKKSRFYFIDELMGCYQSEEGCALVYPNGPFTDFKMPAVDAPGVVFYELTKFAIIYHEGKFVHPDSYSSPYWDILPDLVRSYLDSK